MKPIRIAITQMPRMLREIIEETVAAQADMVLVDAGAVDDLAAVAAAQEPDVVVSSAEPSPGELADAFAVRPGIRVIVLDRHDGRGILHELRPDRIPLGEASPQRLIAAIRAHLGAEVAAR